MKESFAISRAVREALAGEFPAEVILEVYYAVDYYARHLELGKMEEDFLTNKMTKEAEAAFLRVKKAVTGAILDSMF